jgi:Fur family transcriptional regulator, iron response regulator
LPSVLPRPATANWREKSGCVYHDLRLRLKKAGLRPTRQRMGLGWLLFSRGDRHLTAEALYEEASAAGVPVSLATVYNTLHQFTEAGLLREVAVDGSKTHFDTNITNHHHFFVENESRLLDIEGHDIAVASLPDIPEDMEVVRVEVIVRLKRKSR